MLKSGPQGLGQVRTSAVLQDILSRHLSCTQWHGFARKTNVMAFDLSYIKTECFCSQDCKARLAFEVIHSANSLGEVPTAGCLILV